MSEVQQVLFKVILVQTDTTELENLLIDDWRIGSGWNHPKGCLMVMEKLVSIKKGK